MANIITGARSRYNDESLVKATGKTWDAWFAELDGLGARDLPHGQIATLIEKGAKLSDPWWCQAVTIGYEQHIGRRVQGQDCNGQFTAYASRTITGALEEAMDAWVALVGSRKDFNNVAVSSEARISASEKYRYWRIGLANDSNVTVMASRKDDAKSIVSIDHRNVESKEAGDEWKVYWKALLAELKPAVVSDKA